MFEKTFLKVFYGHTAIFYINRYTHTFESGQFLELPVITEAKARGALPLLLFDRGLRSRLFPLQQLCGGRHTIAALPVGSLEVGEKVIYK